MSSQWILVRHGDTEWTERNLLHGGRSDSPLSAKGKDQAQLTAERLSREPISVVYSSPQGRSKQTAQFICDQLGVTPRYLDGLREYDFGWMEGKSIANFNEEDGPPRIVRKAIEVLMRLTGERTDDFYERVDTSLEIIHQANHDAPILIVTHWGVLSAIAALMIGEDLDEWRENAQWAPCGISKLQLVNERWEFVEKDNTDHLKSIRQQS